MGCVRPKFLTKTRFPIWRVALSYLSELSESLVATHFRGIGPLLFGSCAESRE